MRSMFYNCKSLKSLNLSNIDTSRVTDMNSMFKNCLSLKNLDISSFKTLNVNNMDYLFSGCNSLETLNLSSFDTSNATSMMKLFYGCFSLVSLDLSNFNTSKVKNMMQLFDSCTSIKFLNLSNFKTSSVLIMSYMFNNCKSLLSLDISNFHLNNDLFLDNIFNTNKNLAYVNMYNLSGDKPVLVNLFSQLPEKTSICVDEKNDMIYNIFSRTKKCIILDCSRDFNTTQKKFLENENCFDNCDYIYNKYRYKGKCYKNCPNGTLSSSFDKYICVEERAEEKGEEKEEEKKEEEFKEKDKSFFTLNIFKNKNLTQKYKGVSNTVKIFKAIDNDIQKGSMNSLFLDVIEKKEDIIINYLNTNYQLTTSYNQENIEYKNISSIHLGKCETILKEKYNISQNENLIILKLEYFLEGITIPILTYEIINPKNNEQLDLKYCDKEKINYKILYQLMKKICFYMTLIMPITMIFAL